LVKILKIVNSQSNQSNQHDNHPWCICRQMSAESGEVIHCLKRKMHTRSAQASTSRWGLWRGGYPFDMYCSCYAERFGSYGKTKTCFVVFTASSSCILHPVTCRHWDMWYPFISFKMQFGQYSVVYTVYGCHSVMLKALTNAPSGLFTFRDRTGLAANNLVYEGT
jgi:hypothetical protein